MPRKKTKGAVASEHEPVQSTTAVAERDEPVSARPGYIDGPPVDEAGSVIRGNEKTQGRSMTTMDIAPKAMDPIAADLRNQTSTNRAAEADLPAVEERGKNWGDPYKAIVTTQAFEMGENRRFKQRVFKFKEKPADDVIAALKDAGFTYRVAEKAWTVAANPDSRKLSDELAQQFRGPGRGMEL